MTKIEAVWENGKEMEIADSWEVFPEDVDKEINRYLTNTFEIGEVVEGWTFKGLLVDEGKLITEI